MNRRRWMLLAAVLGTALWLVIFSGGRPGAGPETAAGDPRATTVSVPENAVDPRPAVAVAPAPAPPPAPPAPPAKRARQEPDPYRPFAIAGETEEDRSERARERHELDQRWTKEAADGAWANDSGQRISELLARNQMSPGALRAVDCRQSICRFELQSATNTDQEVMGLIHAARELDVQTWVHPLQQSDGTWRMEVFFPKQGYRLSGGGGRIDELKQVKDSPDLHVPPSTEEG